MRDKFAVALAVMLVMVFAIMATTGRASPPRPPWERADGTVDVSKLPATEDVIDHTGTFVGTAKTSDDLVGIYPLPVYGPDDEVIGHVGENGFWALGDPEPIDEDAYTIVEEFDASGNLVHTRTIDGYGEVVYSWNLDMPGDQAPSRTDE